LQSLPPRGDCFALPTVRPRSHLHNNLHLSGGPLKACKESVVVQWDDRRSIEAATGFYGHTCATILSGGISSASRTPLFSATETPSIRITQRRPGQRQGIRLVYPCAKDAFKSEVRPYQEKDGAAREKRNQRVCETLRLNSSSPTNRWPE
jgi:hypothetical protein